MHTNIQLPPFAMNSAASSGQPVIVYVINQSPRRCTRKYTQYKAKAAAILGALQLAFGVLSIAMNSSVLGVGNNRTIPWPYYVGYGIWSPLFWFISGAFGVASACHKTGCLIITTMVMSIFSAVTLVHYCILQSFVFAFGTDDYYERRDHGSDKTKEHLILSFGIILMIICIAEAVVSILAASICCHAVCCCKTHQEQPISLDTTSVRNIIQASSVPGVENEAMQSEQAQGSGKVGENSDSPPYRI